MDAESVWVAGVLEVFILRLLTARALLAAGKVFVGGRVQVGDGVLHPEFEGFLVLQLGDGQVYA